MLADTVALEGTPNVLISAAMEDLPAPLKEIAVHPYLFRQHFSGPCERPKIGRGVNEMDWSYLLTCHAAQGSEFPDVTVIDDSSVFRDDADKWLYTAITRASQHMTLLQRSA